MKDPAMQRANRDTMLAALAFVLACALLGVPTAVDGFMLLGYPCGVFLAFKVRQFRREALEQNCAAQDAWERPPHENMLLGDVLSVILVLAGPVISTIWLAS